MAGSAVGAPGRSDAQRVGTFLELDGHREGSVGERLDPAERLDARSYQLGQHRLRLGRLVEVGQAPPRQLVEDGLELESPDREAVGGGGTGSGVAVGDETLGVQVAEPVPEQGRADAGQGGAELGEPLRLDGELAEDQQVPPVAHHVERPGDGAELAVGTGAHGSMLQDSY
ncbi:MAG: hypothetical protein U5R31_04130 [Acidimicrobiia bacterium]|nr:hypothetical protein [Acidimicrobiia bacterium]